MNSDSSILLLTDSYKPTHYPQYPENTSRIFSFLESRGGRFPEVLYFGLQYILKRYLVGQVVTDEAIREAKELFAMHFGNASLFNEAGWRYILNEHGGRLPVEIRAIPEGTRVPVSNALMTVVNTDPKLPWLTNYLESLLVQTWYPTTVATQSYFMRETILRHLKESGTPEDIDFKLHDFGFRGSTSVESAGIGGAAHLVNFRGTDNLEAIMVARRYYGETMAGFSIPAAEHSTITSWGRDAEVEAYRNMLRKYPTGAIAIVSDSYDIFRACRQIWGDALREEVLNRQGVTIIRPDSGEATKVLPNVLGILGERFGYTLNTKHFRVLNDKIRLIQGDGIDYLAPDLILDALKLENWSADNIAFGSGGGLLQKVDRDTQKFAFKCSAAEVDGIWRDVKKEPVTDPGKRSKAGRLALLKEEGKYRTVQVEDAEGRNELVPVFRNGELLVDQAFADIRKRALA